MSLINLSCSPRKVYVDHFFAISLWHSTLLRKTQHSHRDTYQNRDILLNFITIFNIIFICIYALYICTFILFIFFRILFLFCLYLCFQFKGITLWGGKTNRIFSLLFVFQFSRTKYTHRENYINACW